MSDDPNTCKIGSRQFQKEQKIKENGGGWKDEAQDAEYSVTVQDNNDVALQLEREREEQIRLLEHEKRERQELLAFLTQQKSAKEESIVIGKTKDGLRSIMGEVVLEAGKKKRKEKQKNTFSVVKKQPASEALEKEGGEKKTKTSSNSSNKGLSLLGMYK